MEFLHSGHCCGPNIQANQRARIVVSDSPGLVDFLFEQVSYPMGKLILFLKFKLPKNCNKSCSSKFIFGLVEMTFGLVHNRWFSRYVIAAMLVDSKQKVAH